MEIDHHAHISQYKKMYFLTPNEDSAQPAHGLIGIFTGRILDTQGCKVSSCDNDASDQTEHSDLNLRSAHMSEDAFSHRCGPIASSVKYNCEL